VVNDFICHSDTKLFLYEFFSEGQTVNSQWRN